MSGTRYQIQTMNPGSTTWEDRDQPRQSKDGIVSLATKIVSEERIPTQVVTVGSGKVVWEESPADHGRRARRTPRSLHAAPYFRLAPAPKRNADGIADAPSGWEICYVRARRGVALIRSQQKRNDYAIMNAWTGHVLAVGITTTRDASDAMQEFSIKRDAAAAFDTAWTVRDYVAETVDA